MEFPPLGRTCQVWWARTADAAPSLRGLLDADELRRLNNLVRDEDRHRMLVGAALARIVVAFQLGKSPAAISLDRTCPVCGRPHGKPRVVEGAGIEVSIAHSGARVVVAVTGGCALGVDVERVDAGVDVCDVAREILSDAEQQSLGHVEETQRHQAFFGFWTRKEAVVKATGDGLRTPLKDVIVSGFGEPARLVHWSGRPEMSHQVTLADLTPGAGYTASVAVLSSAPLDLVELDGSALLRQWT